MKRKWLYEIKHRKTGERIIAWEPCKGWSIVRKIPYRENSMGEVT